MDVTPEIFEDVIGAYTLDACEPDEVRAIDEYVLSHPEAATEVERLREAAAALGSIGALQPPSDLRDRLLQAASERVTAASAQAALEAETERFDALLDTIDETELDAVTHNGLNVQELVAHVESVDRAFADEATTPRFGFIGASEIPTITEEHAAQHGDESFAETVTRFRRTRADLVALGDTLPEEQRLGGYRRDDTLVIRTFETWTHNDDIRRALGREPAVPAAPVVRAMSELAMHSLPLAMAVAGTARPDRTARMVLTGPGGGEWTIACGPGDPVNTEADVVITASALDFCRCFADRVGPGELAMEVEGDEDLARELVASANVFAGL